MTCVCRRQSWTPETQPNGAVRRRLVEFLVFKSIYLKKSGPSKMTNRVGDCVMKFHEFRGNFVSQIPCFKSPASNTPPNENRISVNHGGYLRLQNKLWWEKNKYKINFLEVHGFLRQIRHLLIPIISYSFIIIVIPSIDLLESDPTCQVGSLSSNW